MAVILNIETSGPVCSVALGTDGKLIAEQVSREPNAHAARITLLIDALLKASGKQLKDIAAIAVSEGPGSYTGLRIGAATAKGLCYALDIPLIPLSSLRIMAAHPLVMEKVSISSQCVPMIDARRMEIYTAVYDHTLKELVAPEAVILDTPLEPWFDATREALCFGSGMPKAEHLLAKLQHVQCIHDIEPLASSMISLSERAFTHQQFADVAYFEPFYLKPFFGTKIQEPGGKTIE